MKKAAKLILGFISGVIIFVIMLPLVVTLLLQVGFIQQWAVETTSSFLTKHTGMNVSISKMELGLFKRAYFEDVYIEDFAGDTMLYVEKLNVRLQAVNFFTGKIDINTVTLDNGKIFLHKDSLGVVNIKPFFDSFKPEIPPHDPPNFRMTAMQVNLLNVHFKLYDETCIKQENGVNFKDLDIRKIYFQAQDINIFNYDVRLAVNFMRFNEKCGFELDHFSSTACGVNGTGLRFDKVEMETPHTSLHAKHINFLYTSWWAYSDFVNMVTLDVDLKPSLINFKTVTYFIPEKIEFDNLPFRFEGNVVGPVPRLTGRIDKLEVANNTVMGNFIITGLPDTPKTTFEFDLEALNTSQKTLDDLIFELSGKHLDKELATMLSKCGDVVISGRFDGLTTDFNANCVVNTQIGVLDAGFRLSPNANYGVKFFGNVSTPNFELGKFLSAKNLGNLTFDAQVEGKARLNNIEYYSQAHIKKVHFNKYDYTDIMVDGEFANALFSGHLSSSKDSNLLFSTTGTFDFSDASMPKYNFEMQLKKADLYALKINQRDSISILSADFKAHFEGTNIDNINGNINIDSIYYANQFDTIHSTAINAYSINSDSSKELRLESHFADIKLQGKNSYRNIFGYFGQMAQTYIPAFDDATEIVTGIKSSSSNVSEKTYDDGFYTLEVNVKQANNVASAFLPGLEIAEGTKLDFFFNPAKHRFSLSLNSEYISNTGVGGGGNFFIEEIVLDSRNVSDSLSVFMTAKSVNAGGFEMPNASVIGGIKNNRISLATRFNDPQNGNSIIVNTTSKMVKSGSGVPQIDITLHPSSVKLNNASWLLQNCNIIIDTTGVEIDNFVFRNSPQSIAINGKLGKTENDTLNVVVNDFEVKPLSFLIEDLGYNIEGLATGQVQGVALLKNMQFYASAGFENIKFAGYSLPDSKLKSTLDRDSKRILISLKTETEQPVSGYYDIRRKRFNVNMNFPELDMVLLEPLLQGILTNTKGSADVKLTLSGKAKTPALNGTIKVKEYSAMVDFTKVTYHLAGDITVKNNRFELAPTKIFDSEGHSGDMTAFFDNDYFKNLRFGINARFTDLLALNTTEKDNSLFYGKAYGTGVMDIKGTELQTKLNVTAQTAGSSSIVMPFNNISTVDQATFIKFVDPNESLERDDVIRKGLFIKKLRDKVSNELDINLDIQVLPNTTALVQYTNSIMNNIIRGQGRGRLRMRINPSQEIMTLEGPMEIEKGSYRLILEIADKTFNLQPGGRLNWSGDPANPNVDFTGIYKVRTSLEPLTGTIGGGASSANIDCGITLNGSLWNPNISFSIKAPSATPETQNVLRNTLNTEEAISMQFLSLFISNSFMPDMGNSSIGNMGGSFFATTGYEFLSSQIGALLSTKNFNFRPTYRPRTETGAEEIGFKASINLVQDKVLIEAEGNYATTQTSARQNTPFTGGGNVTVLLNKSGTLSLKGFTRVIDRFDETQGLQESGFGVYFRQDFQNWADLQRRYRAYRERLENERQLRQELREQKRSAKHAQ